MYTVPFEEEFGRFIDCFVEVDGKKAGFTRNQADGAVPNGTWVEKCNSEATDTYPDGHQGIVIGSLGPVDGMYFYFVAWENRPEIPVGIAGNRVVPTIYGRRR